MQIGGIETHGGGELVAGFFGFANLKERVGEILPDRGPGRSGFDSKAEEGDRLIVLFVLEELVGSGERGVGRVCIDTRRLGECKGRHKQGQAESHNLTFLKIVGRGGKDRRLNWGEVREEE